MVNREEAATWAGDGVRIGEVNLGTSVLFVVSLGIGLKSAPYSSNNNLNHATHHSLSREAAEVIRPQTFRWLHLASTQELTGAGRKTDNDTSYREARGEGEGQTPCCY